MTRNIRRAIAVATLGIAFAISAANADSITINETGSTLLYPLFKAWIDGYKSAAPDVVLTAAGTGSGVGIDSAIGGSVRIGASDAYLSDEVAAHNPEILNIPLAISAVAINYNLPGLNSTNIKISGPVLAAIYSGGVTQWDDPKIAALNPGIELPRQGIIPVRRADASGDTFVFTQFLDFSAESWEDNPGYGTDIAWPKVTAEKTAPLPKPSSARLRSRTSPASSCSPRDRQSRTLHPSSTRARRPTSASASSMRRATPATHWSTTNMLLSRRRSQAPRPLRRCVPSLAGRFRPPAATATVT
jgi:hypothetical protein